MRAWNDLPEYMRNDSVWPYYESLCNKKISLVIKRVSDMILAVLLLGILLIPMIIIGILIVLDSPGGALYQQQRVTRYGKVFKIYKFRTMVSDADKKGSHVTLSNDDRITHMGKYLRDIRFDEIPQLLNVLSGDMSFVGTRPEALRYVEAYTPEMYATLLLPAGITSEASIKYKDEAVLLGQSKVPEDTYITIIMPEKMRYNLESIRKFSCTQDFKTMILTIIAILK